MTDRQADGQTTRTIIIAGSHISPICLLVLCMSCVCQLLNKRIYDDDDDELTKIDSRSIDRPVLTSK